AAGDPTAAGEDGGAAGDEVAARAHRFTVLVPAETTPAQIELVRRVVELEKPAHTAFAVKHYWALLRVGEVRLGLDTQLGEGGRWPRAIWPPPTRRRRRIGLSCGPNSNAGR